MKSEAKQFAEASATCKTWDDFYLLMDKHKKDHSIGHKYWGFYAFDDDSLLEYAAFTNGLQIWPYHVHRAMVPLKNYPKVIKLRGPIAKSAGPHAGPIREEVNT